MFENFELQYFNSWNNNNFNSKKYLNFFDKILVKSLNPFLFGHPNSKSWMTYFSFLHCPTSTKLIAWIKRNIIFSLLKLNFTIMISDVIKTNSLNDFNFNFIEVKPIPIESILGFSIKKWMSAKVSFLSFFLSIV